MKIKSIILGRKKKIRRVVSTKRLTLKQNIQIGIRRCTDKPVHWIFPMLWMILFLELMFLTSMIPHATKSVSAQDYPNKSMQITFTGDTLLGGYIQILAERNGYESLFADVKDVWTNSDYVFTNLEFALLPKAESKYNAVEKKVTLSGSKGAIRELQKAGINTLNYANDHSSDYGSRAFCDAISWLYQENINFSGYFLSDTHMDRYEKDKNLMEMYQQALEKPYTILECKDNSKVGFLGVVDPRTSDAALSNYVMKITNPDFLINVNKSALETDLTVVYIHWGSENTYKPQKYQEEYAHQLIDAGADIVIGNHSHTIQPVEKYNGGIIFYSLGNFIMDQIETDNRDGVIVQYNKDGNNGYFELIPFRINDAYPQITANQFYISRINHTLTKRLDDWEYDINEKGHIILPWNK